MKILLLVGIFSLSLANISASKTITCNARSTSNGQPTCLFSNVKIEPNDAITLKTNPEDADVNTIMQVHFWSSSIYSVPQKVFTKFPNLKAFLAMSQNIQEIKAGTFANAKKLERIDLWNNSLVFLHVETFQGKISRFSLFLANFLIFGFFLKGLENLKIVSLNGNQLQHLHHDTFKDNLKLTWIDLNGNQLSSLHPQMFAHLDGLEALSLFGNTCVD